MRCRAGPLGSLRNKRQKLFDLMLDGNITDDYFTEQERQLTAKIDALADAFEQTAAILRDPAFEPADIWDNHGSRGRPAAPPTHDGAPPDPPTPAQR